MTDRVVVAELGLEGGGATVLGFRVGGRWRFWQEGSSITLDADDGEEWQRWASEQSEDLAAVVPATWTLMFPVTVHPEFVEWFRCRYEAARAGLDVGARESQARHPDRHWQRVFAGRPGA
jgi:hypothetical protein